MPEQAVGPRKGPFDDIEDSIRHIEGFLVRIGEEVVLPAFGRNYDASGLKSRGGAAKQAFTKRGATGNVFQVSGDTLTAGVDPARLKYLRWIIDGRGPVTAKKAKALRFVIDGQVIFRKRVKAAPPHRVVYLTAEDLAKANEIVGRELGKDWTARIR